MLKNSSDWLKEHQYSAFTVLDPDGWDRSNFELSWNELITEKEFNRRLCESTIIYNAG